VAIMALTAASSAAGQTATAGASPYPSYPSLKGKTFYLVTYWLDSYGQALSAWSQKWAKAEGVTLKVIDGKGDATAQRNALDTAIVTKPAGILWQPIATAGAGPEVKKIWKAGIPLVIYGSALDPKTTGVSVPAVVVNDYKATYKAGQIAAADVAKFWPGTPPKVVAFDARQIPLCAERIAGFLAGLKQAAPNTVIVFHDDVATDEVTSRAKMQDVITATPGFNVVMACGSNAALGQISALQSAGRAKAVSKVPQTEWILAMDGTPPELTDLFDPTSAVMMSITVTPRENATSNLNMLANVVTGKTPERKLVTKSVAGVILPANCQQAVSIFNGEYGILKNFKPITCP